MFVALTARTALPQFGDVDAVVVEQQLARFDSNRD